MAPTEMCMSIRVTISDWRRGNGGPPMVAGELVKGKAMEGFSGIYDRQALLVNGRFWWMFKELRIIDWRNLLLEK